MSMPKIKCRHIDKCCAATSLLQSIALEETAISHILNAEGEKLQKAIYMDKCSQQDLLEVNQSVENMVEKITNLEMVLKEKLDRIVPLLKDCDKKPPHKLDCQNLTTIALPAGVKTVPYGTFNGCTKLSSVQLGSSLTDIEIKAFYNCISLKKITLPNSLRRIGDNAFGKCYKLSGVKLGNNVNEVGMNAFLKNYRKNKISCI